MLAVYVAGVVWRALRGAPPSRPIRFSVCVAVSAVIHLGFHAAATAAPSIASAVALVLAGWTSFGMWCLWIGRTPSHRFRPGEDETDDGGGGGGGRGPEDDHPTRPGGPPGDDDVDWDAFERDFAAYVQKTREPEPAG